MKIIILLIGLSCGTAVAQQKHISKSKMNGTHRPAGYSGDLLKIIASIKVPKHINDTGIQGNIYLTTTIYSTGAASAIQYSSLSTVQDAALLKAINTAFKNNKIKWKPATRNGVAITSRYNFIITDLFNNE